MADVPAVGAGVMLEVGFASGDEFEIEGAVLHAVSERVRSSEIIVVIFFMWILSEREIFITFRYTI